MANEIVVVPIYTACSRKIGMRHKKTERFKPFYRYKTIRGNKNIFVDLLIIEQPKHPGAVAYSNLDLLYLTSAVCKNGSFCGCHTATGKRGQATNEERVF